VEHSLIALFIVGLLGVGHCVGMCGGIVGALSMQGTQGGSPVIVHLAYNLGRISSYAVAGLLVGALGQFADNILPVQQGLFLFAHLMLVALGLYLLGLTQTLAWLEKAGQGAWKRIQPLTRRFLPVRGIAQAFPLGMLWGWLPCGLVYGALASAMAAGSAGQGALLMLAFGAGTLPGLLLAGLLFVRFRRFAQARTTRILSGLLVAGFGIYGLGVFMLGILT